MSSPSTSISPSAALCRQRQCSESYTLARPGRRERRRPGKDQVAQVAHAVEELQRASSRCARCSRPPARPPCAGRHASLGRKLDRSGGGRHRGMRERPHRVTTGPRAHPFLLRSPSATRCYTLRSTKRASPSGRRPEARRDAGRDGPASRLLIWIGRRHLGLGNRGLSSWLRPERRP
jgi:hypothetical protein